MQTATPSGSHSKTYAIFPHYPKAHQVHPLFKPLKHNKANLAINLRHLTQSHASLIPWPHETSPFVSSPGISKQLPVEADVPSVGPQPAEISNTAPSDPGSSITPSAEPDVLEIDDSDEKSAATTGSVDGSLHYSSSLPEGEDNSGTEAIEARRAQSDDPPREDTRTSSPPSSPEAGPASVRSGCTSTAKRYRPYRSLSPGSRPSRTRRSDEDARESSEGENRGPTVALAKELSDAIYLFGDFITREPEEPDRKKAREALFLVKWAFGIIQESRDDFTVEVLKNSMLGRACKFLATCKLHPGWGPEAEIIQGKAIAAVEYWRNNIRHLQHDK